MAYQGIDLTGEVGDVHPISWHEPHAEFVIILVGSQEVPFGIQKDLLCAKSPYYRQFFNTIEAKVEHIVRLPNTEPLAFGCFQNFLYTGTIYKVDEEVATYGTLLGVWKLATELQMSELRVAVLNAMAERRRQTSAIPGATLMIQAWQETEQGSGLRIMLITWAAEHMRQSEAEQKHDFARSLPQEILSELVINMAGLPPAHTGLSHPIPDAPHPVKHDLPSPTQSRAGPIKRPRKSAPELLLGDDEPLEVKPINKKAARKSEPAIRRKKNQLTKPEDWTTEMEMEYCKDLIERMIRGPGYWTRLVGPFRQPVDPEVDHVPNYFDVIKKPMDLSTIRQNVHGGKYENAAAFENDVRQIFKNCYEYWTQEDPIWKTCTDFERYFDVQFSERFKWQPGGKNGRAVKAELVE